MSEFKPKTISEYTAEQKVAIFDKFLIEATEYFNGLMTGEIHDDNDCEHYFYEDVVSLLGDGVWDAINNREEDE